MEGKGDWQVGAAPDPAQRTQRGHSIGRQHLVLAGGE